MGDFEEIRAELRARLKRFCRKCSGNILCGNCKYYRKMLEKGIKIEKADCLEVVAVDYIAEILDKKEREKNDLWGI